MGQRNSPTETRDAFGHEAYMFGIDEHGRPCFGIGVRSCKTKTECLSSSSNVYLCRDCGRKLKVKIG